MSDAAVRLERVGFAYPDGTEALRGATLAIEAGESVGIVGPNGAGKSTLALLLSGCLAPSSGTVEIAGLPARRSTLREVRRRLGLVFENPDDQLFLGTLADDIAFGPLNMGVPPEEVGVEVGELLDRFGLGTLGDRFPGHLSAGQKRAAAIACVLAMKPEIVLLDDPTANLDPRSRRTIIGIIGRLPGTRIVISHDLEMVLDCCRRVVLLDGGSVVADGPAARILGDGPLLDAHGLEKPHSLTSAEEHRHVHAARHAGETASS